MTSGIDLSKVQNGSENFLHGGGNNIFLPNHRMEHYKMKLKAKKHLNKLVENSRSKVLNTSRAESNSPDTKLPE